MISFNKLASIQIANTIKLLNRTRMSHRRGAMCNQCLIRSLAHTSLRLSACNLRALIQIAVNLWFQVSSGLWMLELWFRACHRPFTPWPNQLCGLMISIAVNTLNGANVYSIRFTFYVILHMRVYTSIMIVIHDFYDLGLYFGKWKL